MYYIQGRYGADRFYTSFIIDNIADGAGKWFPQPHVGIPVGVTQRPADLGYGVPLDWAKREGNVTALYRHEVGGHFAAYQTPDSLLEDCWNFFGNPALSRTGDFVGSNENANNHGKIRLREEL